MIEIHCLRAFFRDDPEDCKLEFHVCPIPTDKSIELKEACLEALSEAVGKVLKNYEGGAVVRVPPAEEPPQGGLH